ncbi:S8/S53 family peptidase [Croceicoccus gelatinilyticus]|uniref:S8/S53 family peptidase n=1 Tax=Croceicoccus gelatinilyticus TaxID=2835536 RepID=UPI001BCAB103|nr:S8/S53 family peptidase [Croceicoccus gelatinilyticus]MBS7671591.1 S8/S53 family peptidase [Croceicoccus gelatinilyticus]
MNIVRNIIAAVTAIALATPALAQPTIDVAAGEEPIRIAVVDSGVYAPPADVNATITRYDARKPKKGIVLETEDRWKGSHGTLVTSIILRETNRPLDILAYRAERKCGKILCEMSPRSIAAAVRHAADNGAKVIQISSYGRMHHSQRKVLEQVAAEGVHIVLCAGNQGGLTTWMPLLHDNPEFIHVIGALDEDGNRAEFSANGGSNDELIDYRDGIALEVSDFEETSTMDGTSFSASLFTLELIDRFASSVAFAQAAN